MKKNTDGLGCLVTLVIGLCSIPFIGFWLLLNAKGNKETRLFGLFLIFLGCAMFVWFQAQM